ncbi:hypothetical protein CDV55_109159 [Aspergillus turcosus]|uniref:Uncharacterized protein n=1 Tax=Aspergillus turcosus TaxID=1245748 RepID=A0A229XBT9_9EURO|nr:hypothetical protein CDV55_109159 [Aspergillus turcosus]RLL96526.1 hypothetical protein CFD26_106675 [Aspergillus turcosus]
MDTRLRSDVRFAGFGCRWLLMLDRFPVPTCASGVARLRRCAVLDREEIAHGLGEACVQVSNETISIHAIQRPSQDSLTFAADAEQLGFVFGDPFCDIPDHVWDMLLHTVKDCPIRRNPESTEPDTGMGSAAHELIQKNK